MYTYSYVSATGTFIPIFLQIEKEDVDSYGFYNAGLPQFSIDLYAKDGCKDILHHKMNIKGATDPDLSIFIKCYSDTIVQG